MKKLTASMTHNETLLGWIYLVFELTLLQILLYAVNVMLGNPFSDTIINVIYFTVNFLAVLLIFHKYLWKNTKIALENPLRCLTSALLGFAMFWAATYVVAIIIIVVYPDFYNVNDSAIGEMFQENAILMAVGTIVFAPLAEEVLFRGLIFRPLYNRSPILGYLVSTLGFAALHVIGYIGSYEPLHLVMCFLQYLPAGIALGFAYARSNTIWSPILFHMVVNLISTLVSR